MKAEQQYPATDWLSTGTRSVPSHGMSLLDLTVPFPITVPVMLVCCKLPACCRGMPDPGSSGAAGFVHPCDGTCDARQGLASPRLLTKGDECSLGLLHPPANAIAHVQTERSRIAGELGETGNPRQAAPCFRRGPPASAGRDQRQRQAQRDCCQTSSPERSQSGQLLRPELL